MRTHVYFIQQGMSGPVKIGYSKDPLQRLASLQVGNAEPLKLLGTYPGGPSLERTLHRYFEPLKVQAEWFEPDAELMDLIDNLNELDTWVGNC